MAAAHLQADPSKKLIVRGADLEWTASPSSTVWRRRLALEGASESGRVTSIVKYEPSSQFKAHGHPNGEEILVLEGAWQDANGEHARGTYMLNPEGFEHAPGSRDGCVLFVKLKQYGGLERQQKRVDTEQMAWTPVVGAEGIEEKVLYHTTERVVLERWQAEAAVRLDAYDDLVEVFLIDGSVEDVSSSEVYSKWTWFRLPIGEKMELRVRSTATVYKRIGEWRPETEESA